MKDLLGIIGVLTVLAVGWVGFHNGLPALSSLLSEGKSLVEQAASSASSASSVTGSAGADDTGRSEENPVTNESNRSVEAFSSGSPVYSEEVQQTQIPQEKIAAVMSGKSSESSVEEDVEEKEFAEDLSMRRLNHAVGLLERLNKLGGK